VLVCDTTGLLAYFDASDAHAAEVAEAVDGDPGPFVVSPYVLAELDYLLSRRGVATELEALAELSGGAWELPSIDAQDLRRMHEVMSKYRDHEIGVADASLVVLSNRFQTDRLLTLDRRHFGVLRTLAGGPFSIVPR
jgi:predicted nucleic acid-binding protein